MTDPNDYISDPADKRLRYLLGRLAMHADTAMLSVDGGRIEELCHLILHELRPAFGLSPEDIAMEAVRLFEEQHGHSVPLFTSPNG